MARGGATYGSQRALENVIAGCGDAPRKRIIELWKECRVTATFECHKPRGVPHSTESKGVVKN